MAIFLWPYLSRNLLKLLIKIIKALRVRNNSHEDFAYRLLVGTADNFTSLDSFYNFFLWRSLPCIFQFLYNIMWIFLLRLPEVLVNAFYARGSMIAYDHNYDPWLTAMAAGTADRIISSAILNLNLKITKSIWVMFFTFFSYCKNNNLKSVTLKMNVKVGAYNIRNDSIRCQQL